MPFTSQELQAVHRQTKAARSAGQRLRRAAPVQLVRAFDHGGAIVLVALSRSKAGLGYVLLRRVRAQPAVARAWVTLGAATLLVLALFFSLD